MEQYDEKGIIIDLVLYRLETSKSDIRHASDYDYFYIVTKKAQSRVRN